MYMVITAVVLLFFVALIIGANVWRLREGKSMYRRPTPSEPKREEEPGDRV